MLRVLFLSLALPQKAIASHLFETRLAIRSTPARENVRFFVNSGILDTILNYDTKKKIKYGVPRISANTSTKSKNLLMKRYSAKLYVKNWNGLFHIDDFLG